MWCRLSLEHRPRIWWIHQNASFYYYANQKWKLIVNPSSEKHMRELNKNSCIFINVKNIVNFHGKLNCRVELQRYVSHVRKPSHIESDSENWRYFLKHICRRRHFWVVGIPSGRPSVILRWKGYCGNLLQMETYIVTVSAHRRRSVEI